jgi:hypothetical protein
MPRPSRSPAMSCRPGFRLCLSHLIYTVRPCLIHTYHAITHAAPLPCSDHAVLTATSRPWHSTAGARHGMCELALSRSCLSDEDKCPCLLPASNPARCQSLYWLTHTGLHKDVSNHVEILLHKNSSFWPFNIRGSTTNYLTQRSGVLLEKLTVPHLVKKLPAFYGTLRFIATFTTAATCPYPEPDESSPRPLILFI